MKWAEFGAMEFGAMKFGAMECGVMEPWAVFIQCIPLTFQLMSASSVTQTHSFAGEYFYNQLREDVLQEFIGCKGTGFYSIGKPNMSHWGKNVLIRMVSVVVHKHVSEPCWSDAELAV